MKKIIPFLFFVLILASSVYAPSTVINQQITGTQDGLLIEYPKYTVLKMNQNLDLNIHVFNLSNGVQMNQKTTNCTLHLYNTSGNHILISPLDFDNTEREWTLEIDKGNFSYKGFVSYIIFCNSTQGGNNFGGSVSGIVDITKTGITLTTDKGIIYSTFLMLFVFMFIISVIGSFAIEGNNEFDLGGKLIKINKNKYIKYGLFFLSYLLLIFIFFIASKIAENYLTDTFAYTIINFVHIGLWILLAPIFILFWVVVFIQWALDIELQKLADRGLK